MTGRRLILNLDAVAVLRQARGAEHPDPVSAATLALLAGADGVGVHLREDRRHTQDRDARLLRQIVRHEFHLDVAALPEMIKVALETRPDAVTLVPELPRELATGAGVDVAAQLGVLGDVVRALEDGKIRSGLLIEPDIDQVKAAHRVGVRSVRIHTGRYAEGGPDPGGELARIRDASALAAKLGLVVSLGGGLDYRNVRALLELDGVAELCVGHAVAARAVLLGMERAVREMKAILG